MSRTLFLALTLVAVPSLANTALAQTAPQTPSTSAAEATVTKRATLTVGADLVGAYMFRGIFQEDAGSILEPYVDVGIAAGKGVSINFGNWQSQHSSSATGTFYESDYYVSLTGTAGKWKPGVLFTSYQSPGDRFVTVNELAGVLAYDDSANAMPVSPKIVIAQELSGQADGGATKGTYLEAGLRPTVKLVKTKTPLNLGIPLKLGMSLRDYYELGTASSKFGYFDVGFILSVPVSLSKGTFEIHGGVDILTLGETNKLRNLGDKVKPVASFGFSYVY